MSDRPQVASQSNSPVNQPLTNPASRFINGLAQVASGASSLTAIGAFLAGVASLFGVRLAEIPQLKLALVLAAVVFIGAFVVFVLNRTGHMPRIVAKHARPVLAVLGVFVLGLLAATLSSYYGPRTVDSVSVAEAQPKLLHIAFHSRGNLMAAEFTSYVRVRQISPPGEWTIPRDGGVHLDRMSFDDVGNLHITLVRLGDSPRATIWYWKRGELTGQSVQYALGPSSNTDPQKVCPAVDYVPDVSTGQLVIGYSCTQDETAANGFVDLAGLGPIDGPAPARGRRMLGSDDPPRDEPNVKCKPLNVAFVPSQQFIISVVDCQKGAQHQYQVGHWREDDGALDLWTPLGGFGNGEILGLTADGRGQERVIVRTRSRFELLRPINENLAETVSFWDIDDPIGGTRMEYVSLSPDGRWIASFESQPATHIALSEFGVWVAGLHAQPLDTVWPRLQAPPAPPAPTS